MSRRPWLWILLSLVVAVVAVSLLAPMVQRGWVHLRPGATLVLAVDDAHPFDAGVTPDEARRRTLAVLRDRLERVSPSTLVAVHDNRIEIVLPRGESIEKVQRLLTRTGRLEFKLVDDGTDYMKQIAGAMVAAHVDGIEIGRDGWTDRDSGTPHPDVYLRAPDPAALAHAWAVAKEKLPLPDDHDVAFEAKVDADGRTAWRSYYLYRRAELTGDHISEAEAAWDPQSNRPEVSLAFDSDGAKAFEALTARAVGRKLAILLEGRVNSAPVIEGKIAGGRARITMGGNTDPFVLQKEAKDLVAILRAGGAAAPVTVVEVRPPR